MPLSLLSPPILIITGAKGDTRRYRVFHLYQQLRLAGGEVFAFHISDARAISQAEKCRVLVLHRVPYDSIVARLIDSVRRRAGLVLVDHDDLIFDPAAFQWIDSPDFQDPIRAQLYQKEMKRQKQTVLLSDGVVTSTDYLAEVVRKTGKPAWVHRNAANLEMIENSTRALMQKRQLDGKYVIGYASGTPTHNRDFAMIAPGLMETLKAFPEAELWIIGHLDLTPDWQPFENRVRSFKSVPWRELPFWLTQIDVNLAPLVLDNPFSQSKSEIKFMEAALVSVPTIASPTDAFAFAIRPSENGLLARTAGDWQAALAALADPARRAALGAVARNDALTLYTPQCRAQQAVELLNQIAAHFGRADQWQFSTIPSEPLERYNWPVAWENAPSLAKMGLYSLQSRGVLTLLKQLWITLRRIAARWVPYR